MEKENRNCSLSPLLPTPFFDLSNLKKVLRFLNFSLTVIVVHFRVLFREFSPLKSRFMSKFH